MNYRLCVMAMAVILAASSLAICAEEIETTPEEVRELLKAVKQMIEEGKLDEADIVLEDAIKEFRGLTDKKKTEVDKDLLRAPFELAEKLREDVNDEKATALALKWYDSLKQVRRQLKLQ